MANFSIAYLIELKDRYTPVAKKVAQVNHKLQKSFQRLRIGLKQGGKSISMLQDKMKKLKDTGMTAFTGISIPIGLAIGGIVKMGSELEDTRMVFTTMLGDATKANKMVADVMKMASKTPFETPELLEATKLMLNFGVAEKDVMKNLQMLGDISGGNKQRFQGLSLAFSQVQSQGRLMGQDLLQMINAGFNPLKVISEKTGKSMNYLKEQMSKGAISAEMVTKAMEIATSKGGRYYQLMAKQSTTFNGLMSTLSDNIGLTASLIGEKLLPYVKPLVIQLIKWTEGLQNINPRFATFLVALGLVLAIIPALMVAIGVLGNSILSMVNILRLLNVTMLANPYVLVIAGIVLLVAWLMKSEKAFNFVKNVIATVWNVLSSLFYIIKMITVAIFDFIKPILKVAGFLLYWLTPIWAIVGALKLVGKTIAWVISKFGGLMAIAEKFKNFSGGVKNFLEGASEKQDKQREIKANEANGNSKTDVNINMKAENGTKVTSTKVQSKGNNKPNVGVNQAGQGR